ncbi:WW domain-binding protein 1 isoform X2 [Phyllostomus discolor]|uniref:WW domain-binding protein 1 isoform X2 n=1 Tax=Phyllostomus discolor TaxID=89673 RepID=A0A6J2M142_9CHIR|nr:WW domain-binding protein 1 isoform X2 [Phyllostomus discolor]XP_035884079.1 WW domain-binding protein 1 isoform X2 [Phyllostomus discolor]
MSSGGSGFSGQSSSSLAAVAPSVIDELNSDCSSSSGSVRSTLLAYHGACHGGWPCSSGSLLDLRLLSAFKPPSYEDVVHRPGTPPPPYTTAGPRLPFDCFQGLYLLLFHF